MGDRGGSLTLWWPLRGSNTSEDSPDARESEATAAVLPEQAIVAEVTAPLALVTPPSDVLTVDVLRAKLDSAIIAERWDAVAIIGARLRELERGGVVDLASRRRRG